MTVVVEKSDSKLVAGDAKAVLTTRQTTECRGGVRGSRVVDCR